MTQFPASNLDSIAQLINLPALEPAIDRSFSIATPDTPVLEAIALMDLTVDSTCKHHPDLYSETQHCRSCVLVVETTQLVGIFTKRDATKLTTTAIDLSQVKLGEVMTRQVITLTQSQGQNILAALSLLDRYGIHHLPILAPQGQPVGIVTPGRIRQVLLQGRDPLAMASAIACWQQQVAAQTAQLKLLERQLQPEIRQDESIQNQLPEDRQQLPEIFNRTFQFSADILSQIDDAVMAIDRQHCIIYWNRAAEQFYNLKADVVLGQHIEDVIPDPWFTAADVRAAFAALTTQAQPSQHIRVERSRGEKFLEVSISLLKDDRNTVIALLAIVRDISDRHRAEEALLKSEEQRRLAIDLTHIGSWDWQLASGEVTWNENHFRLLGLEPGETEASYQTWRDRVHPEDLDRVEQAIALALETHTNYEIEYRVLYPDSSLHWLLARGKGLDNAEGKVVRMVGMLFDISDRISAEQKIREQASLLDITTDAICVRDLENRILYWNKGAERLYGWQAEAALGKNAGDLLCQEDLAQIEIALQTVIAVGEWQGELHKVTQAGSEVTVMSRWTLIRDEAAQPKSILIVDTDITQKKQLEAQFLRAQRLENLGILAGGIAHDLNNILTPILAVAQLLPLKLTNLELHDRRLLTILEDSAKRGTDLVKQILTFARGTEEKRVPLQVKHLLLDVESIVRSTFPKSIEIERDIPDNLWTVTVDATQIHQVLMNLAVNARDAMPNGGKISISAANCSIDESYARMNLEAKAGDYVVITFADTGIGIAPEIVEQIFDSFFTTKAVGKGTGLGLSTVRGIVKSHGGFVEVNSEVGKGTKFRVFLPADTQAIAAPAVDLELPRGHGELILIVDDETAIAEITKTALETHNYRVLTAHNGIEAIALYALHKYEIRVVLLDLMMPQMSGTSVVRILQKMNPQVQILAMSGSNAHIADVQAGNSVQGFLSKPFTTQELLTILQRISQN